MGGAPTSNAEDELARARDLGVDTCGRIAEFWGFTRTMGRAFGLLYLSRAPLPQAEIQARLGISAGSASMTLAALQRWGVVHRVWVRGQRREHTAERIERGEENDAPERSPHLLAQPLQQLALVGRIAQQIGMGRDENPALVQAGGQHAPRHPFALLPCLGAHGAPKRSVDLMEAKIDAGPARPQIGVARKVENLHRP